MKKWFISAFSIVLLMLTLGHSVDFANTSEVIDTTNLDKGIVGISYKTTDKLKYKVLISKDDSRISYPFTADGNAVNFPLQLGNGTYKVGLLRNVSGTKYVYVSQKTVVLDLKDPNIVFLNSVQNINWNEELKAIEFGKSLLKTSSTSNRKLSTLYGYMVKNVTYDYDKIPTLTADYIPSVELTYEELKGICYDYSALFASIQRNHGIPTKLVKGYSRFVEGYHAWNEIYIGGKWVIIDSTVDSTWKGTKASVTMIKSTKDYTKVNEY
ncbi:MAG TPA: transglutaminase [Clostridiales bacterium UBA8960]|jgi:hypothetical protein|nr:transglutaminase [Clostridiales bacterium UBA8960]